MTFYNMVFTAFPLIAKAIFDQDVYFLGLEKRSESLVVVQKPGVRSLLPFVYKVGQTDSIFNSGNFLLCITKGIIHGFMIWLTSVYAAQDGPILTSDGLNADFWFVSVSMFTSVFVVATLQNIYMVRYWTVFNVLSLSVLSVFCYVAWIFLEDNIRIFEIYGNLETILASPIFYLIVLLNAGWFSVYDYAENYLKEIFSPSVTVKARSLVKSGSLIRMTQDEIAQTFELDKSNPNKIRQK